MVLSFLGGLLIFFALLSSSRVLVHFLPVEDKTVYGVVGAYTADSLPDEIQRKISIGLTSIEKDGSVTQGAAQSWEIGKNGRMYTFMLRDDVRFSDGKPVRSRDITYDFADVAVERPDDKTIRFILKDAYAPFLVTVSRPIYKKGLIGIGEYRIRDIELNGNFVRTLTLVSTENRFKTEKYIFYPSADAVKLAFILGEINRADGLFDTSYKDLVFSSFPNVTVAKNTDYSKLVTIFYNTKDPILSDSKMRRALTYALPSTFPQGERVYVPIPPHSLYYSSEDFVRRQQDMDHAKVLLDAVTEEASTSGTQTVMLKTLSKYRPVANSVANAWKELGVDVTIEDVESVPQTFQAYLGDFNVPKDPDQYTLWHSNQQNNITGYRNLRIDKLLEDGRKVVNADNRRQIYYDFQKYLLDDSPASFLYFPYEYEISKT